MNKLPSIFPCGTTFDDIYYPKHHYSTHYLLDLFIETFSSSSSNEIYEINEKRKIKKEIMKKFFKNRLCLFIDEYINKEKSYNKK